MHGRSTKVEDMIRILLAYTGNLGFLWGLRKAQ